MPKATADIRHPVPPVIALHQAAEALIVADVPRITRAYLARCHRAVADALAARADSVAELAWRIEALRETLAHEEASDFALGLIDAIARDVAALAAAPRTAMAA